MKSAPVTGWLVALLVALGLVVLPLPPWAIDHFYSRRMYRWWQGGVTAVSNLVSFAVLDVLILAAVVLICWRAALLLPVIKRQGIVPAIWEATCRLIRGLAAFVIVFLLMWGLNYRRIPLEADLPPSTTPTVDELRTVVYDANGIAARVRPNAVDAPSFESLFVTLRRPFNDALIKLGRTPLETAGRPKSSLILTPFFTAAGVNGMVNPLALETIVHPDLLPFERSFALAHEWAHLSGTADEAEASAIGWLACMDGPPELAYSASIYLILEAGNALPAPAWRDVRGKLDAGVKLDLEALSRRLARQRPHVQRAAFRVYDEYLRANRVEDGIASYSRALSLILSPPLRDALSTYREGRREGRLPN